MRPLLPGSILLLLSLTSCVTDAARPAAPSAPTPAPDGWLAAVTPAIHADARAIRPRDGVFVASLPRVGLEGRFLAGGLEVVDDAGEPVLGLSLVSWGRGERRVEVTPVEPDLGACGPESDPSGRCIRQLEYAHEGGLTEWWLGEDTGVEQGWTLAQAPEGDGAITFVVAIDGALETDGRGPALALTDASGRAWTVDGIAAWDARGDAIPASARFDGDALVVEVDDAGATYPITVDPVYTTAAWSALGGNPNLGHDVAGVGDLDGDGYDDVVVTSVGTAGRRGAAYVYPGGAAGLSARAATVLYGEEAGAYFGASVAGLGDVDGDGYDDVAIGASGGGALTGHVYVHRGSPTGISETPDTTLTGASATASFGEAVAAAGDVDGNGHPDLLVGAGGGDTAYLFPGSAAGIATTAATTLTAPTTPSRFGQALAGVGDIDGDGYDDVVIGAERYLSYTGAAYLYTGSATGLGTTPVVTMTGTAEDDMFGGSVAGGGDLNGDGYPDVVVGALYYGSGAGMVYIYHGSAGGISSTASTMLGPGGYSEYLGSSVAIVGDVQGDGYDDLLVGSYAAGWYEGLAALYSGTRRGVDSVPTVSWTGTEDWAYLGISVDGAGDVNGDGYIDLLVGASGLGDAGAVYVFHGSAAGMATTATRTLTTPVIDYDATAVASAGDLNADGYDDFVIGNGTYDSDYGIVYVYLGSVSGPAWEADQTIIGARFSYFGETLAAAGDINGDGYDDLLVGSPSYSDDDGRVYLHRGSATGLATTATSTITGSGYDQRGAAMVAVGDVNGDGKDDVVLGAPDRTSGGYAYLYRGSTSGLSSTSSASLTASSNTSFGSRLAAGDFDADGNPDLAVGDPDYTTRTGRVSVFYGTSTSISTTVGRSYTGEATNHYYGAGMAVADVNGDGYDDLVVGAYGYGSNTGKAYVYYGGAARLAASADATITSPRTTGYFGETLTAIGDLDGDGFEDVAFGDSRADSSTGSVYVFSGSAAGLPSTPTATLTGSPPDAFGTLVTAAGDVNGDGFDDLLVGGTYFVSLFRGYDADADLDGAADDDDCDDADASVYPGAVEVCDGVDQDCDGVVDEGLGVTLHADTDGDGYGDPAAGVVGCAGAAPGYVTDATDCDDTEAAVFPGATEACNGVDDDCDGTTDEDGAVGSVTYYADADGDGAGGTTSRLACTAPSGWIASSTDCNDGNAAVHPGATETCNTVDDDCDGSTDEAGASGETDWYADADGDRFGDPATATRACTAPAGYVSDARDCDDGDGTVSPSGVETCDGEDDDCDGTVDDGVTTTYHADIDGDGYGGTSITTAACSAPTGFVTNTDDCDDGDAAVHPGATETCDAADDDCDGAVDEGATVTFYADADGDGYGDVTRTTAACAAPSGYATNAWDCDDTRAEVNPLAEERCNALDDDCDGRIDPDDAVDAPGWYLDGDGDGYGDDASGVTACAQPDGTVDAGGDCDDADATVSPGAAETWYDGLDQDCDGGSDADADRDGHDDAAHGGDDCDDTDGTVSPGAEEVWYDGIDQDCAGGDDFDADGDGQASDAHGGTDCDDADASVYTGAPDEPYDGVVRDCALASDNDADADGHDDADHGGDDCDDARDDVHPGASEVWYDGTDQDCDGNDGDQDADGFALAYDCDDTDPGRYPNATEIAGDGVDQDCDGLDAEDDPDKAAGCGCAGTGSPGSLVAVGVAVGLLTYRRRRQEPGEPTGNARVPSASS